MNLLMWFYPRDKNVIYEKKIDALTGFPIVIVWLSSLSLNVLSNILRLACDVVRKTNGQKGKMVWGNAILFRFPYPLILPSLTFRESLLPYFFSIRLLDSGDGQPLGHFQVVL